VLVDGGDGNDQIQVVCMIDSRSTGFFNGLVRGGDGDDNLTFDVFFVDSNGLATGSGHGHLTSFIAVLDGGLGFDTCQKTADVFAKNCEA